MIARTVLAYPSLDRPWCPADLELCFRAASFSALAQALIQMGLLEYEHLGNPEAASAQVTRAAAGDRRAQAEILDILKSHGQVVTVAPAISRLPPDQPAPKHHGPNNPTHLPPYRQPPMDPSPAAVPRHPLSDWQQRGKATGLAGATIAAVFVRLFGATPPRNPKSNRLYTCREINLICTAISNHQSWNNRDNV
ncbi:hypothetical protein KBY58_02835 [Cyanobium sp. HWJ4-Hawea]|uniref:hypothetical protein n=1 Tax=Cyanobium sp. HWJ4-Hawea TaxID=2823713 RepID=UPI0020CFAF3B|nr:hypothetical protein [Cyanobium sp. HWJ4-Hawea]MCP9808367.1 hypothetical protein [Cyanobium sp. HWJ4-Hawea]